MKVETRRSLARRPSSRSASTAPFRADRSGLPSASDNIRDGTWVILAARTSCPNGVLLSGLNVSRRRATNGLRDPKQEHDRHVSPALFDFSNIALGDSGLSREL